METDRLLVRREGASAEVGADRGLDFDLLSDAVRRDLARPSAFEHLLPKAAQRELEAFRARLAAPRRRSGVDALREAAARARSDSLVDVGDAQQWTGAPGILGDVLGLGTARSRTIPADRVAAFSKELEALVAELAVVLAPPYEAARSPAARWLVEQEEDLVDRVWDLASLLREAAGAHEGVVVSRALGS